MEVTFNIKESFPGFARTIGPFFNEEEARAERDRRVKLGGVVRLFKNGEEVKL